MNRVDDRCAGTARDGGPCTFTRAGHVDGKPHAFVDAFDEVARLKGELAEARGLLEERVIRETCIPCGRCITCRTLDFLSRIAPPPAESTPVLTGELLQAISEEVNGEAAPPDDIRERPTFARELESLINRYSQEQRSNTPDFILQDFLLRCLNAWNECTIERDRWYGMSPRPGGRGSDGRAALDAKGESGTHAKGAKP